MILLAVFAGVFYFVMLGGMLPIWIVACIVGLRAARWAKRNGDRFFVVTLYEVVANGVSNLVLLGILSGVYYDDIGWVWFVTGVGLISFIAFYLLAYSEVIGSEVSRE